MTGLKDARPWLCVGRRALTAITLGRVWGSHTPSALRTIRTCATSEAYSWGSSSGPRPHTETRASGCGPTSCRGRLPPRQDPSSNWTRKGRTNFDGPFFDLTPEQAGLHSYNRNRRVPELRSEVADLAGSASSTTPHSSEVFPHCARRRRCRRSMPPVCYRASWQLPGPDFHRQATASFTNEDQPPSWSTSTLLGARNSSVRLSSPIRRSTSALGCRRFAQRGVRSI